MKKIYLKKWISLSFSLILLLLMILPAFRVQANSWEPKWVSTWDNWDSEVGRGVWGDAAGGIYTVGVTQSLGDGPDNLILVKWNATTGVRLWNYTWGGLLMDWGNGVWTDAAGGVYTVGGTESFGKNSLDLMLIKWDATTGTLLWNYTWGGLQSDWGNGVWGDAAGGVYTVGYTSSFGAKVIDVVLIKWNATTGVRLWNYTWGGSDNDQGHGIWGDGAGGIYTVGVTHSIGLGPDNLILVKWDATTGTQLWNYTWGGSDDDQGHGIWGDGAGGIYTVGYTKSFGAGDEDLVLIKFDATTGVLLWNYTWGGSSYERGDGIWGDGAGGIYTVGYTKSFGNGLTDLVLVKWNATTGVRLWNYTWGSLGNDQGYGIWGDAAGEVYTVGFTPSLGGSDVDILLIKWGSEVPSSIPGFPCIFLLGSIMFLILLVHFKRRSITCSVT